MNKHTISGTLFALCSHNVSLAEFITAANKGTELPEALNKIRMRVSNCYQFHKCVLCLHNLRKD